MSSDLPQTNSSDRRSQFRFLPVILFLIISIMLFIGGSAAISYLLFSEYTGVRNIWLLICGAPFIVVLLGFFTIYTLYSRYGRPLRQILNAIDSVGEGNLSVRVPDDNSPQFGELIKRFNKMVSELERSDQQRRNLTADIAHELRTPLHIIQGNLEGIIDGVYPSSLEQIKDTLDEVNLMTRLVNDLQTLSLAESGQLPLHPTRFLLAELIQDLTSSFSIQAASQGIELRTSIVNPQQELTADYDRLNQVLSNLITNALRHTPGGGTVSIETGPASNEERDALTGGAVSKRSVRIMVQDTGVGIALDDLPFIFDRFWRADRSRSDREHTGLGLAITKQLVHAHGGTIDVQSEVGKGTTFTIEL